jgi:hypothetical protein
MFAWQRNAGSLPHDEERMTIASAEPKLHGNPIADTAIRQPVLITMLMLLAVVIGLLAYSALPVNYLPDISVATVSVSLNYPGAGPQTMADVVAKPVEDTLTTINGIDHITTTAGEGSVQITAQFQDSVDPNQALQNVRDKVNAVVPSLPSGVSTPVYRQFDPNDLPVLQLAVSTDGSLSPLQLRTLIDNTIVPQVERVDGVGSIDVNGGQQRQINVLLNLNQLQALHIAPAQVSNAIRNANINIGLGTIQSGDRSINLRAPSQITQPSDIAGLPIAGTAYQVGDVARIEDGVAEPSSYARLDGQPAVTLAVHKESGSNTVAVAEGARQMLQRLFAAAPHLTYYVTNDQSLQVRAAVDSSIEEIILAVVAAVVAAMLVVLLFFRNLRNTLVTVEVDAEATRQAEITGIQVAEQQIAQAQTSEDKLKLPASADTVAQAQTGLDQAKATMAKLSPAPSASDIARTSASVRQAQTALDAAKLDREHAELHAPFAGVVAEENIDPGDPSSTAGQVPIRVIDISSLHVDANVSDADIDQITLGQTVQVSADAGAGRSYTGKVSYIAPAATISGSVRTYLVRVALVEQTGLRPGMNVRVRFAGQ